MFPQPGVRKGGCISATHPMFGEGKGVKDYLVTDLDGAADVIQSRERFSPAKFSGVILGRDESMCARRLGKRLGENGIHPVDETACHHFYR